jgi:hypothetical protein
LDGEDQRRAVPGCGGSVGAKEPIRPDQIDETMNRVVGQEARYRLAIDMSAA